MAEPLDKLTVALWATNLAQPLNGIEAWAARVDERMAEAKAEGADILVMPEYAAEQWLSFAPESLAPAEEISWLAAQAPAALEAIRPLARKHDTALLAGTMPVGIAREDDNESDAPPFVNRAHLFLPDGRLIVQDKLCLTPGERDPKAWNLSTGDRVEIVEWRGLRLASLICLDVELPALASLLAPHGLDLLLVPSMTEKLSGYSRVFSCAKARAVELQAIVCAVGCIGKAAASKPRLSNTSGAAAYLPCEEVLGHSGVAAELPPSDQAEGAGPMLIARDLPVAEVRALRAGRAEVWPGAWSAAHVTVGESS
ncbi:MAG: nitrilase-related carbon-nitrogen hydrolase [Kiloniellales bacterium]